MEDGQVVGNHVQESRKVRQSFQNLTKANVKTHQFITRNTESHRILEIFREH